MSETLMSLLLAIFFILILVFMSFGFSGKNYFSVDIFLSEINQRFLVLPFILSPAVFIFIVLYVSHAVDSGYDNRSLWVAALFIAIIRFSGFVVASRIRRVPLIRWTASSFISILVAWLINQATLYELNTELGFGPTILFMLILTVIGLGSWLSYAQFGNLDETALYEKSIRHLFRKYQAKYGTLVDKEIKKGTTLYFIFFSIMITEDLNRPKAVRLLENLIARFRPISTTGIMQMSSQGVLSDSESVVLAVERIKGAYSQHSESHKDTYEIVRSVAGDYNGDAYPDLVTDVYYIIKNIK